MEHQHHPHHQHPHLAHMLTKDETTGLPIAMIIFLLIATLQSLALLIKRPLANRVPKTTWNTLIACRLGSPVILLIFRATAFVYCCYVSYEQFARVGIPVLRFYTVWSWYLLVTFFGLATILSAMGIYASHSPSAAARARLTQPAGVLQHVVVGMWHMNMTTVLLVDVITWTVLKPMYNRDPDPAKVAFWNRQLLNFTSYNQHGFNLVLMYTEMFLDHIPALFHQLGLVGLWTVAYGVWVIMYFQMHRQWLYPFLRADRWWAPLSYFGLLVGHWVFFGLGFGVATLRDTLLGKHGNTTHIASGKNTTRISGTNSSTKNGNNTKAKSGKNTTKKAAQTPQKITGQSMNGVALMPNGVASSPVRASARLAQKATAAAAGGGGAQL